MRQIWRRVAVLAAAMLGVGAAPAAADTILFVGNSFTYGALSPVRFYRPASVTDLNGEGIGGVPALFKAFADQAGLDWTVSLETTPAVGLPFHFAEKRAKLGGGWDVVVLQGLSVLDPKKPGDPEEHIRAAGRFAEWFRQSNPKVRVELVTTWSRADQTYKPTGHWYGKPISAMVGDLAAANALALRTIPGLSGAIPVGQAWNLAMERGVADPNPYDGVAFGQLNLWGADQYHGSTEGYYLEALVVFGAITGVDPRKLGKAERAGLELGLTGAIVGKLQAMAAEQLVASGKLSKQP